MPISLTFIEVLLALAVLLLAANEVRGLLLARRRGLTRNVSRVVTHSAMVVLMSCYTILAYSYRDLDASRVPIESFGTPTFNWTYVLSAFAATLLLAFETGAMVEARLHKRTRNVVRSVTRPVMLFILLALMSLSLVKWDHYMERLEASYAQDIRGESEK